MCMGDSGIRCSPLNSSKIPFQGVVGPENIWIVNGSVFADPDVIKAMEVYGRMLDYQNSDHSALSWDQAVKKLIEGSVFSIRWAIGPMVNLPMRNCKITLISVSHPEARGQFYSLRGFMQANNAPNPENVKNWLCVLGSKEATVAFNPLKGLDPRSHRLRPRKIRPITTGRWTFRLKTSSCRSWCTVPLLRLIFSRL